MRIRRQARLRVGLGPGLTGLPSSTGHGKVWGHVLAELSRTDRVKLVERGRADVWLANGHEEPPEGRPLVVQVHEIGWHDPELRAFLRPDFARQMETATTAALDVAAHVITPSEATRLQITQTSSVHAKRVHAVPHGVDRTVFKPGLPHGRERVGAEYVLSVAVLHPRKNLPALRTAAVSLARSGLPRVLVTVEGPAGDHREATDTGHEEEAELAELGVRPVKLGGLTEGELAALMAGASAFCLPSFFEGFGLPALEAMACGTPVVVSNRGALPEVVGDAGLIVNPDPEAIEHALRRLLTEPELAERLRTAGSERAAGFGWDRTAAGWLDVLEAAA